MRRSTPSAASSSVIDPQQLAAIAKLWKRTGRTLTTRFTGTSMRPAIDDGAEVTLICIDDVKVGDVVAYVYGDRVIVHRLVAQWGDRFVARGDANFLPDPVTVERDDIIGKIATPPPARPSRAASAFLAAIGVLGARTAMRIVGVLRRVGRAGRRATTAPEAR
jgi:signal peptidase I